MGLHFRNKFFMKIYLYIVNLFTIKKDKDKKEEQIFLNDFENMEPDSSDLIFME